MPWLARSPRPIVVNVLRRFAEAEWTARDIELAAHQHLTARQFTMPATAPAAPAGYLRWLLSAADVDRPPAQIRDVEQARHQQVLAIRRQRERQAAAEHGQAAQLARTSTWGMAEYRAARAKLAADIQARQHERRVRERDAEASERTAKVTAAVGAPRIAATMCALDRGAR